MKTVMKDFLIYNSTNKGKRARKIQMGRKPKIIPHIPGTMKQIVKSMFAENAKFAKEQRAKRKKSKNNK